MTDEHQQPQGGPEGLSEDPIVERLVPDPSQPPLPPPVVLAGLLGRSVREGHWRLYFSSTLESYAEFKEEDVINSVKIPQEQPPFAGLEATRVWLRRDAEIEYTRAESRRMQAEFLSGELNSAWQMQAEIENPGAGEPQGGCSGGIGFASVACVLAPKIPVTPVRPVIPVPRPVTPAPRPVTPKIPPQNPPVGPVQPVDPFLPRTLPRAVCTRTRGLECMA